MSAGGATGGCAGTATAASARYGARLSALTSAHSSEEGESTVGVYPLTLNTGYRIIGLAHRAQDIELALTIVTGIFVDRHSDHLLQLFSITFYLSLLIWSSAGIRNPRAIAFEMRPVKSVILSDRRERRIPFELTI